jgi:hypothetical protein
MLDVAGFKVSRIQSCKVGPKAKAKAKKLEQKWTALLSHFYQQRQKWGTRLFTSFRATPQKQEESTARR